MNGFLRTWLVALLFVRWSALAAAADAPPSAAGPLRKLLESGRLPAERQGTVLEMICNRGNEHDLRVVFDRVVAPGGLPPEVQLKALGWLADAAVTRKVKPTGELAALDQLVVGEAAAKNPARQRAAIRLAAAWRNAAVAPALRTLATDSQTKPELQRAAVEGLVAIGDPESRATLARLSAGSGPRPLRAQATAGLAALDLPAACAAAAAILAESTAHDAPDEMLKAILNRKGGAEELAAALGQVKLPADIAKRALRYMYSVGRSDAALSDLLSKAAGIATDSPPPTAAEIARLAVDVATKGDPARGEAIFRRQDLNCMKCHSVSRAGGQVGPELSALGGSSPIDYVLNSILNPNLAIKEQYVTRSFALASGEVLTGVVVDRNDVRVNLRDADGKILQIPVADVEQEVEGKSLMPQGLTRFLTREELLDLARFISELGKPGPYAVQQARTIQRWRVLREPAEELLTSVPHLEHVRQLVLSREPESWRSAYARVAGVLPLDELREGTQPTVLILQGELTVSAAGKVRVKIDGTETAQSWFDDQPRDAQRSFEVELTPGRHTLTLRVEVSAREKPELRVEFLPAANSAAVFEVVGGA